MKQLLIKYTGKFLVSQAGKALLKAGLKAVVQRTENKLDDQILEDFLKEVK